MLIILNIATDIVPYISILEVNFIEIFKKSKSAKNGLKFRKNSLDEDLMNPVLIQNLNVTIEKDFANTGVSTGTLLDQSTTTVVKTPQ